MQSRGGAVIKARKLSSAMSAAKAICDHLRDWHFGRTDGWTSMGIVTDGKHYGIPENLVYSMPCHIKQVHLSSVCINMLILIYISSRFVWYTIA